MPRFEGLHQLGKPSVPGRQLWARIASECPTAAAEADPQKFWPLPVEVPPSRATCEADTDATNARLPSILLSPTSPVCCSTEDKAGHLPADVKSSCSWCQTAQNSTPAARQLLGSPRQTTVRAGLGGAARGKDFSGLEAGFESPCERQCRQKQSHAQEQAAALCRLCRAQRALYPIVRSAKPHPAAICS